MTYIAIVLVLIFAVLIIKSFWWQIKARWSGIEADATVSRIERDVRTSDGAEFPRRFYYVCFQAPDGQQNESRLLNPKDLLVVGTKVKIRYLPEKNDCAVLTKVTEE